MDDPHNNTSDAFTYPGSSFILSDGTLICGSNSLEILMNNRLTSLRWRERDEYENGKKLKKVIIKTRAETDNIIRDAWLSSYDEQKGKVDFWWSYRAGTYTTSSFTHSNSQI